MRLQDYLKKELAFHEKEMDRHTTAAQETHKHLDYLERLQTAAHTEEAKE